MIFFFLYIHIRVYNKILIMIIYMYILFYSNIYLIFFFFRFWMEQGIYWFSFSNNWLVINRHYTFKLHVIYQLFIYIKKKLYKNVLFILKSIQRVLQRIWYYHNWIIWIHVHQYYYEGFSVNNFALFLCSIFLRRAKRGFVKWKSAIIEVCVHVHCE